MQDAFKRSEIGIIRVPERENRENETEAKLEETMAENFPNLIIYINSQI